MPGDRLGDVDIIVLPPSSLDQSTAIQVKRFGVKLGPNETRNDHDTRLRKLFKKGVRQANQTAAMGFAQVYLWVFVVIDTRGRNSGRLTYAGGDALLRSSVRRAMSPAELDPRVGLMSFEWVQPMDRPPLRLATHWGHLERLAHAVTQPCGLTDRLQYLAKGRAHVA